MDLTTKEAELLEAYRRLPPATADELAALIQRLAALAPGTRIDWSDEWSDADLRDYTAESIRRLEAEEQDGGE